MQSPCAIRIAVSLLLSCGVHAFAQEESAPTLHIASRMVAISALVRGKDNAPVEGLTKDDFELKQDGKDVPIRYFSQASELPLTFAVVVDTSGSQRTLISDEVLASDVFFQTVLGRPQDRAMLVRVDAEVTELIPMTNSPSRLHLGLLGLSARPSAAAGTRLQDAIYAIAKVSMANQTGRKAMIILSDGGDNGSRKSLDEAIHEAQQYNVQVYSILYSIFTPGLSLNYGLTALRSGSGDGGAETLKKLSEQTGGRMYTVGKTPLRAIYAQIADDLRKQYELGYTPPPDLKPGSFHRLELRTKDKKQTVQSRAGFTFEP